MAHWVLRGRMAEHNEDGRATRDEQHRREQNKGYDEAARGGPGMPTSDVGTGETRRQEDEFDREAREAANDVRRRESSAK
jgi:hypothetical protein